jgi:snRNA-activating protein complex subunit 3
MRDPNNKDYSEVIREWTKNNAQATPSGKMETALMEETRFRDLTVRMGYPYVYQHLGDCEHLVIILNVR